MSFCKAEEFESDEVKRKRAKQRSFFKPISLLHIFEQNPNKIQSIACTTQPPEFDYLCVCALETCHHQLPNFMSLKTAQVL